MNILNIRSDFRLAGPGILAFEYAKELKRRGHNLVFCSSGGGLVKEIKEQNMTHHKIEDLAVERRNFINIFKTIFLIRRILINENIDIIHGHNAASTFLAYIATKLINKNIRIINTVHGEGKEFFLKIVPFKLIAVSNNAKNNLINRGIPKDKIFVLHNGIINLEKFDVNNKDNTSFRQEINIKKNELLVGSVAVMTGKKGHDEIIKSIPQIITRCPNTKFVFVGDGVKLNDYKKRVNKMNINDKVIFAGRRRDIPNVMSSLDVFVHMSNQETFGMVLIEAMSMKKPVVARKVGGIPEVVLDKETGFLVNDIETFSEKVIKLLKNKKLRLNMGAQGYKRVLSLFTIDKTIDNLLRLYSKL